MRVQARRTLSGPRPVTFVRTLALGCLLAGAMAQRPARAQIAADPSNIPTLPHQKTKPITDPSGTYSVTTEVTVGTACPAEVFTSFKDGSLRTYFAAYEANLEKLTSVVSKQCNLEYAVQSEKPMSFAIAASSMHGRLFMQAGQRGRIEVADTIRDVPESSHRTQVRFDGPLDINGSLVESVIDEADIVWSACQTATTFRLATTAILQNSKPGAEGSLDLCDVDVGGPVPYVGITLLSRPCDAEEAPAE